MNPKVIPFSIGCEPSPSVTGEVMFSSGWSTFLIFETFGDEIALIECESCVSAKLGYPNDEGLPEHPLYDFGMSELETDLMEVIDSPWSHDLMNQKYSCSKRIWGGRDMKFSEPKPENNRHFIIALKESTFECICSSLKLVGRFNSYSEAQQYALQNLGDVAGA